MQTMVVPPDPAGRIRLTVHYDVNLEILAVTVESAEDLLGVDKDGLSDPYVKLSLVDGCGHTVGDSKKTKPVKNDLNPQFNESFEFSVKSEVLDTCKLCVDVKNHVGVLQRGSQTRELGSVVLNLKALKDGVGFTEWYWLHKSTG
nr:extended synaptotagmin 2 [Hymenolepis microstoma]